MHVSVVGADALAARLASPGAPAPGARRVVVVGGPVDARVARTTEAAASGAHVFVLWPPAPTAAAAAPLGALAEEAGVEIGVARPIGATAALSGIPDGWAARLVTLALVARPDGPLAEAGWATLLAGALDVCATLADARDVARLDAVAERDGDALRAVALAARFENRAYAQATVRFSDHVASDEVALYAARPGSRVEARSLAGPLCVEAEGHATPLPATPAVIDGADAEAEAFVAAVAAGRRAPYALDRALATLRLAELAQRKLR